jgi:hypothetical protein
MFNWLFGEFFGDDASPGSNITDTSSPVVNIDGTPMVGGIDIHGNPFGVTDTTSSLFDDHLSNSMFNDSSIHSGIGCNDIFNSTSTSCFDDTINSDIGGSSMFED